MKHEDSSLAESTDSGTSTDTATTFSSKPSKFLATRHISSDTSSKSRLESNRVKEKMKRKTAMATKNSSNTTFNSCYLEKETEMIKTYVHTDGFQVCTSVVKKTSTIEGQENNNQDSVTEATGSTTTVEEPSKLGQTSEQCPPEDSGKPISWIDSVGDCSKNPHYAIGNADDFTWPEATNLDHKNHKSHGTGRKKSSLIQGDLSNEEGSRGSGKYLRMRCSKASPKNGLRNDTSSSEYSMSSYKPLGNILLSLHSMNSTSNSSWSPHPSTHTSCGPSTSQLGTSDGSLGGGASISCLSSDAVVAKRGSFSKRDCNSSTTSSTYTICETGSLRCDENMKQVSSVRSSSDTVSS